MEREELDSVCDDEFTAISIQIITELIHCYIYANHNRTN